MPRTAVAIRVWFGGAARNPDEFSHQSWWFTPTSENCLTLRRRARREAWYDTFAISAPLREAYLVAAWDALGPLCPLWLRFLEKSSSTL